MAVIKAGVRIDGDASGASKAFDQVSKGGDRAKAATVALGNFLGTQLTRAFDAVGNAARAAFNFLGAEAREKAGALETKLNEVYSLLGDETPLQAFGKSAEMVRNELLDMAGGIGTAEELTGALYQSISAGVEKGKAISFVGDAARLAVAGVTDVETAVDALTTVLNSYGLEATESGKVSDEFFTIVKLGKTTAEELAGKIGQITPIASSLGVEFKDVGAALATLTAQGMSTDVATTALRGSFASMVQSADKFKAAGVDIVKVLDERGLGGAMEELERLTGGNIEATKKFIPDVNALNAVLGLTGGSAELFAANLASMSDAQGAVDKGFVVMANGAEFAKKEMAASVENLQVRFGDLQNLFAGSYFETVTSLVDATSEWVEAHKVEIVSAFAEGLSLVADGAVIAAKAGGEMAKAYGEARLKFAELLAAAKGGFQAAGDLLTGMGFEDFGQALWDIGEGVDDNVRSQLEFSKSVDETADSVSKQAEALRDKLNGQLIEVRRNARDAAAAYDAANQEIEENTGLVLENADAGKAASTDLLQASNITSESWQAQTRDMQVANQKVREHGEEAKKAADGSKKLADSVEKTGDKAKTKAKEGIDVATDAIKRFMAETAALEAMTFQFDLGSGEDELKLGDDNPVLRDIIARLEGVGGANADEAAKAIEAFERGDATAIENLIGVLQGNAAGARAAGGLDNEQFANQAEGFANVLQRMLGQLERESANQANEVVEELRKGREEANQARNVDAEELLVDVVVEGVRRRGLGFA